MADTVVTTTMADGQRNVIVHLQNDSDGTGEAAVKKVDISTLTMIDGTQLADHFVIEGAEWDVQGMDYVEILFDATTDAHAMNLSGQGYRDFLQNGAGIEDPKASGYTGDIMLTTKNAVTGGSYDITLKLRKKHA